MSFSVFILTLLCIHMDKDDLYDSLDELDGTTVTSEPTKLNVSAAKLHYDIASIVPLYGRETLKDYVKPPKKSTCKPKSKIPIPNFTNNSTGDARIMRTNYKNPSPGVKDVAAYNKGEKSYTTMFYTRIGHPNGEGKKPKASDTVRAQWGDYTHRTDDSSISATTHYSDAQSCVSDSTSFYFKLIEENKSEQKVSCSKTTSNLSSITDMRSVSEYSVNNPGEARKRKKTTKKMVSLAVPVLGGLGPDIASNQEKLNRLRKQISYGQKASTQNRIKMMEVKVLKDLKKEMKNSNCMGSSLSDLLT